jgi:hypothetical protein
MAVLAILYIENQVFKSIFQIFLSIFSDLFDKNIFALYTEIVIECEQWFYQSA